MDEMNGNKYNMSINPIQLSQESSNNLYSFGVRFEYDDEDEMIYGLRIRNINHSKKRY